jgi:hypothetical protein
MPEDGPPTETCSITFIDEDNGVLCLTAIHITLFDLLPIGDFMRQTGTTLPSGDFMRDRGNFTFW